MNWQKLNRMPLPPLGKDLDPSAALELLVQGVERLASLGFVAGLGFELPLTEVQSGQACPYLAQVVAAKKGPWIERTCINARAQVAQ